MSVFQEYIRKILGTVSDDVVVNYKFKERKKNIALLKRLISEADCITMDEFNTSEKICKKPEKKEKHV